jgi:hypothetical protein
MEISVKELITYALCPMAYKFKYVDNIETMYLNLVEKYEDDIHKFMYAYHSHIQNNDSVGADTVKRIWGSLWIGEKNKQDLIFMSTGDNRDTWNKRRKQGIENLMTYHNKGPKIIGVPVLINYGFKVPVHKDIYLTGNFELVQQLNKRVQLINFKADSKRLTKDIINKELETTAMAYAFRESFSESEDDLIVYYVDKNKINHTKRIKNDFDILKYSALNIAISIKNKLFYMSPNDKCISCIYKANCDKYVSHKEVV